MNSTPVTDQLNRPVHDLRISVIDRCNFRCPYCMPQEQYSKNYQFLAPEEWLNFDEITRLVQVFNSLGVDKIRITGGEPLLRPKISGLIERIAGLKTIKDLALTTNGAKLKESAADLFRAGLKRLTISLDTINPSTFSQMSGFKGQLKNVLDGIEEAQRTGFQTIKINTVIQKGINDDGILDLIEYFRHKNIVVRFIEYMDVGTCNTWDDHLVVPSAEILRLIQKKYPLKALSPNYYGEVAERYAFEDGAGEVGFISSVSQPFCGSCTRARLTTDGKLITCLFANDGFDLKKYLRDGASDAELQDLIRKVWMSRDDRYSEQREQLKKSARQRVEMFQIGG